MEQVPPCGDAYDPDSHEAAAQGGSGLRAGCIMRTQTDEPQTSRDHGERASERERQKDSCQASGGMERGMFTHTQQGEGWWGNRYQEWDECAAAAF